MSQRLKKHHIPRCAHHGWGGSFENTKTLCKGTKNDKFQKISRIEDIEYPLFNYFLKNFDFSWANITILHNSSFLVGLQTLKNPGEWSPSCIDKSVC